MELRYKSAFAFMRVKLCWNVLIVFIISPLSYLALLIIRFYFWAIIQFRVFMVGYLLWEQNIFCSSTTSILAKLSTWCFDHSSDISCSLLVDPSQTDEPWEGRNTCLWIYIYIYIYIIYIYINIQYIYIYYIYIYISYIYI